MGEKMKDPVCNMEVDERSELRSIYKGKAYVFCSSACKQNFDKNPERYVKGQ